MSDILYIQTDKNVEVHNSHVYLQDVAKIYCKNSGVLNRNMVRKVISLPEKGHGRYVISVMDIISTIQKQEENVDVTHIGEPTLIVTYETEKHKHKLYSWIKTVLVCIITFFGAAFTIMAFNNDVDAAGLFDNLYQQFMGRPASGFNILELTYSIGTGIGVIVFFNHFGPRKITQDPTPMEVEMRLYEDEIDTTIIEALDRKENQ